MLHAVGMEILETERLLLRPFTEGDAEQMFRNWTSDARCAKYMLWEPDPSLEQTRQHLAEILQRYRENPLFFRWAITLRQDKEVIGSMQLRPVENSVETGGVGYVIGQNWWGQGYMAEALTAVIRYGFERVEFKSICASHFPENPASGRVMQKAGMTYRGTCRVDGRQGTVECIEYSLTKEEYARGLKVFAAK